MTYGQNSTFISYCVISRRKKMEDISCSSWPEKQKTLWWLVWYCKAIHLCMHDGMQANQTWGNLYGNNFSSFQANFVPRWAKLSLFPNDDLLSKEIESWKAFGDSLRAEDRKIFNKMLRQCYRYIKAINSKGHPYTTSSLMMSLILIQHQMIQFLLHKKWYAAGFLIFIH